MKHGSNHKNGTGITHHHKNMDENNTAQVAYNAQQTRDRAPLDNVAPISPAFKSKGHGEIELTLEERTVGGTRSLPGFLPGPLVIMPQ